MASQKGQQVAAGDTDNNEKKYLQTTEGNQSTGASSDGHLSFTVGCNFFLYAVPITSNMLFFMSKRK
jgi:hypothetical protein